MSDRTSPSSGESAPVGSGAVPTPDQDLAHENAELRARVAELETELAELRRDTAVTVANAQETLYWFERWGVDFNRVMGTPHAEVARKSFRGLRSIYRWVRMRYFVARHLLQRLLGTA